MMGDGIRQTDLLGRLVGKSVSVTRKGSREWGEDPSPGLAESGLLIIVPCADQHIRCRLRRRSRNRTELADVNGDVPKEGFRDTGRRMAIASFPSDG